MGWFKKKNTPINRGGKYGYVQGEIDNGDYSPLCKELNNGEILVEYIPEDYIGNSRYIYDIEEGYGGYIIDDNTFDTDSEFEIGSEDINEYAKFKK